MTLTLQSGLEAAPRATSLIDLVDGGLVAAPSLSYDFNLLDGIATGQANRMFLDRRTLAAATSEDLNLVSGALLDPFKNALVFVLLKWIFLRVATGPGFLVWGNVTNGFLGPLGAATHTAKTKLGAAPIVFGDPDGWTVTPATAHLFRVSNPGASPMDYDVCLLGTDA